MFDVGFFELLVVGIIALSVLGPDRLLATAKTLGRYVGKAYEQLNHIKQEIAADDALRELQDVRRTVEEGQLAAHEEMSSLQGNVSDYLTPGQKSAETFQNSQNSNAADVLPASHASDSSTDATRDINQPQVRTSSTQSATTDIPQKD